MTRFRTCTTRMPGILVVRGFDHWVVFFTRSLRLMALIYFGSIFICLLDQRDAL